MDKIDTMRAFAAVIATGSFKAGSERLHISPALISKYVSHLEDRLCVRLINRTTRSLSLTEIGQVYYRQCRQLLDDFEELDAAVQDLTGPARGTIRLSAPRTFGDIFLASAVGAFLTTHKSVRVQMDLSDRYVNIVDEGYDLAIRIGALKDSSVIARKLTETQLVVCAAPAYLQRVGMPKTPADLPNFDCIMDSNMKQAKGWAFSSEAEITHVDVQARLHVNSALAARNAALSGVGIIMAPLFAVGPQISEGSLIPVLGDFQLATTGIYAIYPHNRHLTNKVRLFVDLLAQRFGPGFDWLKA